MRLEIQSVFKCELTAAEGEIDMQSKIVILLSLWVYDKIADVYYNSSARRPVVRVPNRNSRQCVDCGRFILLLIKKKIRIYYRYSEKYISLNSNNQMKWKKWYLNMLKKNSIFTLL